MTLRSSAHAGEEAKRPFVPHSKATPPADGAPPPGSWSVPSIIEGLLARALGTIQGAPDLVRAGPGHRRQFPVAIVEQLADLVLDGPVPGLGQAGHIQRAVDDPSALLGLQDVAAAVLGIDLAQQHARPLRVVGREVGAGMLGAEFPEQHQPSRLVDGVAEDLAHSEVLRPQGPGPVPRAAGE
jgi:hypothetical protein